MSNTAVATTKKAEITTVRDALEKMKPQFQLALPKHITPDRLLRVAMTAIQTTPKLLECDRQSLYSAIMKAAQLGLEPDGILGQAYLIPFSKSFKDDSGKWKKRLEVQFIPGYKGLIDLARRSGEVSNIIAKEVCEKDKFSITWQQQPPFVHEQQPSGDRGKVIGFWALAHFKDGGFHWDYMSHDEIIAIRNQSSGWKSAVEYKKEKDSPWEKSFVEMGKKTVIRRIAKFLPMSVQRAAAYDELQEAGKPVNLTDMGDIILENDDKTIEGEVITEETKTSKLDDFGAGDEQPSTTEPPKENAELANWIEDIQNAPNLDGVEYKFNAASKIFVADLDAMSQLMIVKQEREKAAKRGGKKLFAKPEDTQAA